MGGEKNLQQTAPDLKERINQANQGAGESLEFARKIIGSMCGGDISPPSLEIAKAVATKIALGVSATPAGLRWRLPRPKTSTMPCCGRNSDWGPFLKGDQKPPENRSRLGKTLRNATLGTNSADPNQRKFLSQETIGWCLTDSPRRSRLSFEVLKSTILD